MKLYIYIYIYTLEPENIQASHGKPILKLTSLHENKKQPSNPEQKQLKKDNTSRDDISRK